MVGQVHHLRKFIVRLHLRDLPSYYVVGPFAMAAFYCFHSAIVLAYNYSSKLWPWACGITMFAFRTRLTLSLVGLQSMATIFIHTELSSATENLQCGQELQFTRPILAYSF